MERIGRLQIGTIDLNVDLLSRAEARTLARSCFADDPGPLLDSIVEESGGHPLLLLTLARFASSQAERGHATLAGLALDEAVLAQARSDHRDVS